MHHHDTTHLAAVQAQNVPKSEIMRTARVKMEYRLAAERYLAPLLPEASADKLMHCGNYVITQANADRTRERIEIGYYCGQRLCPSCAWRQSVHDAQRLAAISAAAADQHRLRMILVTLTVPNVGADDLRSTLHDLNKAYNKLRKRAKMAILLANTAKKLEITYNRGMDTYHPHLHIICYVGRNYWSRGYVSHDTLLAEWRAATGNRQITQVDIRVCKDTDTSTAIQEVAKYAAKAADYTQSAEVMRTMYHALYGAQRLSLAGIARDLSRAYDRHELDQYIIGRDDTQYTLRIVYQWLAGDYTEIGSSTIDQQAEQLARDGWHELVPEDWGVLMGAH